MMNPSLGYVRWRIRKCSLVARSLNEERRRSRVRNFDQRQIRYRDRVREKPARRHKLKKPRHRIGNNSEFRSRLFRFPEMGEIRTAFGRIGNTDTAAVLTVVLEFIDGVRSPVGRSFVAR